jgi:polyphenol oxidase
VSAGIQLIEPDWPAPNGVRAAFTVRTGGVSVAPYDSLNLGAGIGDSPEAVAENRRRVRAALELPAEPLWLEQVHGIAVVELAERADGDARELRADAAHSPRADLARAPRPDAAAGPGADTASPPRADAVVTRLAGRVCAIRVADCLPVLFAALDGSAVGAAHAGWRGLAGGVLEATVERLGIPSPQLVAWMGPAIGPEHFEVGDDVRAAFMETDADASSAFMKNERGRWQCDLYALARQRLWTLGITRVYGGGWCTFADSDRFFSYRREGRCGRMAALIWMDPERQ